MEGNPTGAMGLCNYLGWAWKSKAGIPIVNVPGCPVQLDNFMEMLLLLLRHAAGSAPMFALDDLLRPTWLFSDTVHEGCDRAGYYEQGDFTERYGTKTCIVKLGCWGPVVQCNVGKRGWMGGIGGCPNVGGICIGCTMPGFPDKFMLLITRRFQLGMALLEFGKRLLHMACPATDGLLQGRILFEDFEVRSACLKQVADAKRYLNGIERLGAKIRRAAGQRLPFYQP